MKVVTLTNQKGGVAKTTTAWTLGIGLTKRGYKVLFVDLDAQNNLAFTAGVDLMNLKATLYDVFKGTAKPQDAIIKINEKADILAGSISFASADRDFTQMGREQMLAKTLKQFESVYDYVIIDTPTTLGVMNENALTASNDVIIPMKPEVYALQGIVQLKSFIQSILEYSNPNLRIAGILITDIDERTNLHKTMAEEFKNVAASLNTKVFKACIHHTIAVGEAAAQRSNVLDEAPNASAAVDYEAFITEYLAE